MVVLPNGATVTALRLDGFDYNGGADVSVSLLADPIGSAPTTSMAVASAAGLTGVITTADVTIASPVISNVGNAYALP